METTQYDFMAEEYEYYIKNGLMNKIDEDTIFNMTGDVSGKSILDLACGYGHYSEEFYHRGASKVVGIDISHKMIEMAENRARTENIPIKYKVSDATKIGSIDKFDIVLAIWLFNHASSLDELYAMFKTCYDNLKDNGILIAYTVNPNCSLEKGNSTKYGLNILSEESIGDCVRMRAEFVAPNPNEITYYRWSLNDYEKVIRAVGFSKFQWITPTISEEDKNKYPNGFWNTFISNPTRIGLVCML